MLLYREDEQYWEVPGGEVKEDESPTHAAVRRAEEETGVEVELEKPFYTGEFQKSDSIYVWHGYLASTDEKPEIQEDVFDDIRWFEAEDLESEETAPNLDMIMPALRKLLD